MMKTRFFGIVLALSAPRRVPTGPRMEKGALYVGYLPGPKGRRNRNIGPKDLRGKPMIFSCAIYP